VIRKCFVVQDPRVHNAEHVVVEAVKWLRVEALDLFGVPNERDADAAYSGKARHGTMAIAAWPIR